MLIGAQIEVTSKPGRGTVIKLSIPLAGETP
jgi:signal transduction histidine kinase